MHICVRWKPCILLNLFWWGRGRPNKLKQCCILRFYLQMSLGTLNNKHFHSIKQPTHRSSCTVKRWMGKRAHPNSCLEEVFQIMCFPMHIGCSRSVLCMANGTVPMGTGCQDGSDNGRSVMEIGPCADRHTIWQENCRKPVCPTFVGMFSVLGQSKASSAKQH